MKIIFGAFFLFWNGTAFAQANNFTVSGNITGLKSDSIFLLVSKNNSGGDACTNCFDTLAARAVNGRFSFNGNIAGSSTGVLKIDSPSSRKGFSIFVESGHIRIQGNMDSLDMVSVTGTISNDDMTLFKKNEAVIYGRIKNLYDTLQKSDSTAVKKEQLLARIDMLNREMDSARIDLINRHPNSLTSVIYLSVILDGLDIDKAEKLYNHLTPEMKATAFAQKIERRLKGRKITMTGMIAPDFILNDYKGNAVELKKLRGRVVLIDFWASWCGPCRAEYPYLREAYKKFKEKGFEIVGVSLDDDKSKWLKAIKEDTLTWINVSDLKAQEGEVVKLYGVQPIPDNFLVDQEGRIIERGLRGDALKEKLETLFKYKN